MKITKEKVLAEAKRLKVELTEEQITALINDGKVKLTDEQLLTVKDDEALELEAGNKAPSIEELKKDWEKLDREQLIEQLVAQRSMTLEARSEAKKHRQEKATLKQQAEQLTKEINEVQGLKEENPKIKQTLENMKTAEKARREAALGRIADESKRKTLEYLLEVDRVGADQFDATVEIVADKRGNGGEGGAPPGETGKVELTPEQEAERGHLGLDVPGYVKLQKQRGKWSAQPAGKT